MPPPQEADDPLRALAVAAGIVPRWQDYRGVWHDVAPETLTAILNALSLPAWNEAQQRDSLARLGQRQTGLPPLMTAACGETIGVMAEGAYRLTLEDGGVLEGMIEAGMMPGVTVPGYHTLEVGAERTILAVAPPRGFTVGDLGRPRPWALAVQLYSLRRPGDGGLGDFRALADLVGPAARLGAAGVAISPVHAQFSADPDRFSPYSPSSRIQLNVLHAGIDMLPYVGGDDGALVDWPVAGRARLAALRAMYQAASPALLDRLAAFRAQEGSALQTHATFEALHAHFFGADPAHWHWRSWPVEFQDPDSPAVQRFAAENDDAVRLHAFMQFMADTSLAGAQQAARDAGMPIGLIADLAVGADSGGSHCWSRQPETLMGLTIGAPPDPLAPQGQGWGLTAFSPSGLQRHGYRAFIEMLRHAMRHAGGVRIDHALGLGRMWVVPEGALASEGAYLAFPATDLMRLIALESHRNRAIVLAEDLGTIPPGFQERLAATGALGMRVLWFERQHGLFKDPSAWDRAAAGLTSTHDLPTVAGWWAGRDLDWWAGIGVLGDEANQAAARAERERDRQTLWAAFVYSGAAQGGKPPPDHADAAADAAAAHLGRAACDLVILPIEDALALPEQPNLPGTTDQHPNWRRRLPGMASDILDVPSVASRLKLLDTARQAGVPTQG